ncbi:hypothetical protein [Compostimonas suwonensis]|uniref:Dolichyl-phosphate-mannose-protein mannosyltransferase n=1 Tax=Compostimonas suwonensis TaxID=1048394 RepID=A0A2M9BW80_9MICO|nr:hypothetical protein [Compostimonas suwonensis]PJJ62213.1 hypothetical protein CLV54_2010 [Compostimonas suwonensis]
MGSGSAGSVGAVVGATVAIGLLTALVFLVRAGDAGGANWPVGWELRSSDNGVLFQVVQDVFAGRDLAWSFSPQVYVFPELPISFAAYLLGAGDVYLYYLFVAVINNCLLFLALLGVLGLLHPRERISSWLARAAVATTPLLILPLIGTSWLVSYHLAPSYYFGMYLMVVAAPALFLVRSRRARTLIGVGLAFTAASNPLALVFAVPAFVCALLVRGLRRGIRATGRPIATAALVLLGALALRLLLLAPLQGTSPLSYIDPEVFRRRLEAFGPYLDYLAYDTSTRVVLVLGVILSIVCLIGAVTAAAVYLRRTRTPDDRLLVAVYLGLVPLTGLAGTAVLMVTNYLYLWPVLIAPFVFVLMALPRGWAGRALPIAATAVVAVGLFVGAVPNLAHGERYFGYRSAETQCLDEGLPEGALTGYATFSDARRMSLTSERGFRLVQVTDAGELSDWLTNRDYALEAGSFFYVNGRGDELAIDTGFLTGEFGEPDSEFSCGDDQRVLVYTEPRKLAAIAEYYGPAASAARMAGRPG